MGGKGQAKRSVLHWLAAAAYPVLTLPHLLGAPCRPSTPQRDAAAAALAAVVLASCRRQGALAEAPRRAAASFAEPALAALAARLVTAGLVAHLAGSWAGNAASCGKGRRAPGQLARTCR